MIDEIVLARMWSGIHFPNPNVHGKKMGEQIARYRQGHYFGVCMPNTKTRRKTRTNRSGAIGSGSPRRPTQSRVRLGAGTGARPRSAPASRASRHAAGG